MQSRFGQFRLDTDRRELRCGEAILRITPKAFQLLQLLVEARPKAVSQQELQDALWPDTFVDEGSLHNLIYQVRQILEDKGHEIIRTVYGYGFSFAAPCVSDEARTVSRCQLLIGDDEFTLNEGENVIGRGWDAAVHIDAPSLSRHHARVLIDGAHATIEDLESKNGTSVAGQRVRTPRELKSGDRILLGSVAARFVILPAPASTETTR